jgi:transcriptional regulator with XRE-family HTH domain
VAEYDDELALGQILLGLRIREVREAAGVTRRQLSNASGVSVDALNSIEGGRRLANLSTLHRIARSLDTTSTALLDGLYPWDTDTPPDDSDQR